MLEAERGPMTRAFVIGNITIDESFLVESLPDEGASIHGEKISRDLGGKGANQAGILARAGVTTSLIAGVGDDSHGVSIRRRVAQESFDGRLVEMRNHASDVSMVFTTGEGTNSIVTTSDCARALASTDIASRIVDAQSGDVAVLQGNLSFKVTLAAMEMAKARGLITAFNPSPVAPRFVELWPLVDLLFINEVEAQAYTGLAGKEAIAALRATGVETVVLTQGADHILAGIGGRIISIPAMPTKAVDPTGAGDTFLSIAIASAILREKELDERALRAASIAASLTVSRAGTLTSFPTPEELKSILEQ